MYTNSFIQTVYPVNYIYLNLKFVRSPPSLQDLTASVTRGFVSDRDDRSKGQRETTALRSTLLARVKRVRVNASINT